MTLQFASFKIQWKPLNVITLGQSQTDSFNQIIILANYLNYIHTLVIKSNLELVQLITQTK